jgi:hypothetical protein
MLRHDAALLLVVDSCLVVVASLLHQKLNVSGRLRFSVPISSATSFKKEYDIKNLL